MLINFSNHPFEKWCDEQKEAASQYGEVVDLPFPQVDPFGDEAYIAHLADEYAQKVLSLGVPDELTVHLMGELTLTLALVGRLMAVGVTCVASTTRRVSSDLPNGQTMSVFRFVMFRKYQ